MTFKDLERRIRSNPVFEQQSKPLFQRLKKRRFWYWDEEQHRQASMFLRHDCCFNHVMAFPKKEGIEKRIFDYQKLLYDSLMIPMAVKNPKQSKYSFNDKHLWVKKATALGIPEFFLRLMVWLATTDDTYRNSQFCIITGPNQDIAIKLIKRMKTMSEPHGITFPNKEPVLEYFHLIIWTHRALENPKFILIDEADFFVKSEQEDVRHVSERYIAKSSLILAELTKS